MNDNREFSTSITLLCQVSDLKDEAAWNRFVAQYSPLIFLWCRRFGVQEKDSGDVAQEVLMKLMQKLRDFSYEPQRGSFRGWLKTVTTNLIRDFQRQSARRHEVPFDGDSQSQTGLHSITDPAAYKELSDLIQQQYEMELLDAAKQEVSARVHENTWEAYSLYAEQELSARDVATQLDMPISEVYVSKSRILKMLKSTVERLDGGS